MDYREKQIVTSIAREAGRASAEAILTNLGLDLSKPVDIQDDFRWMRKSRVREEEFWRGFWRMVAKYGALGLLLTVLYLWGAPTAKSVATGMFQTITGGQKP